jgi:hypothetical protein
MGLIQRFKAWRRRGVVRKLLRHDERSLALLVERADGFVSVISRFMWPEVTKATAFKRDLAIVDLICIEFIHRDGSVIEVNEEMMGWEQLPERLPSYLPGCFDRSELLGAVMQPPFATNETVIYEVASARSPAVEADGGAPPLNDKG